MAAPLKVAVRIRPMLMTDGLHDPICVDAYPYANQIVMGSREYFTVDYALPMDFTQSQIFDSAIHPLVDCVLQGFDTSVITYGQSGAGKSYSLLGPGLHCASSETEYGIIPRVTRDIFNKLMQISGRLFLIKVSFIEICEETIRDLLVNEFQGELVLVENENGSTSVVGEAQVECRSISEVFSWLHVGTGNRTGSWSNLKQRNHAIFTLTLEQQWVSDGMVHQMVSRAQFTELASSDHQFMGDNCDNLYYDTGLAAFTNVIETLTDPACDSNAVSYNQSTLTSLLKDSLGGQSHALLMCCISPSMAHFNETLDTLRLAARARNVANYPVANAYISRNLEPFNQPVNAENFHQEYDVSESNERSTNVDTFGLEFAASQWLKLVANAEGLFAQLVNSKLLSLEEKEQVQRWLCLKQECEECVASDEGISVPEFANRPLERIDELTESEDKTDASVDPGVDDPGEDEESQSVIESESESDSGSQRPDFHDKLVDFVQRLKLQTDMQVQERKDVYEPDEGGSITPIEQNSFAPRIMVERSRLGSRRRSIQPGSEMPNLFQHVNNINNINNTDASQLRIAESRNSGPRQDAEDAARSRTPNKSTTTPSPEPSPNGAAAAAMESPQHELKLLTAGNQARQTQIQQVLVDLEGAQKIIEELQCTIQIKEQFIGDMNKNSCTRASAKQRFQRKRSKLEEEYYKTRSHLAHAENALQVTSRTGQYQITDGKQKHKKEIEKYKSLALHYEKRLKDIESIKQIAGNSARKVLELENSLQTSKKQMEKLKKQLIKEEKHKQSLEQELLDDQRKIKELEQKYNLQAAKMSEQGDSIDADRCKWIQEEEERVSNLRESTQRFQEQLIAQKSILDQREAFLKEKIYTEKCRNRVNSKSKEASEEKARQEKSAEDLDEKASLRLEIHNLRQTRDCLVDQRHDLDEKYEKEKSLSPVEERKLLECDEAIEAIDAAIEYKNELICGRKGQGLDSTQVQREKGEELLVARLMNLSPMEMRTLLYKYFQKVIDLRESGRKMEMQLAELDLQTDTQAWKIQALTNALQQSHFEAERQLVVVQKEHQEKLHLMLRHFAEESSQSSGPDRESDVSKTKRENHQLRKRIAELESLFHSAARVGCRSRSISPVTIPQQNLKQLQGPVGASTTKVTRQKNKLIIQQHISKRNSKR